MSAPHCKKACGVLYQTREISKALVDDETGSQS